MMGDRYLTFGELWGTVQELAAGIRERGIRRGDRIALLLSNSFEFPIAYYASLYIGAVVVPINPTLTVWELNHIFGDSRIRLVIAGPQSAHIARAARDLTDPNIDVVELTEEAEAIAKWMRHELAGDVQSTFPHEPMARTHPDDVAVIMYTAAFSGAPMGAQLTHSNLLQNAHAMAGYSTTDRSLAVLPLFHSFAQTVVMNAALSAGACVVLHNGFDAATVLSTIEKQRISVLALVPTMLYILTMAAKDIQTDISSLKSVLVGGAPISSELKERFEFRFGSILLEGYGLTEASPVVTLNVSRENSRPGSVGIPIAGCDVRIVDPSGVDLPPGGVGEVIVRGHNVMKGYLNQPEATANVIRDSWLYTGDLGLLDAEGYLYLRGLKKNMLIRAGMNIYPREIESVLEKHPAVKSAHVRPVPDRIRGQEAMAFLVVACPSKALEKDLTVWCRDRLAPYKCPRQFTFSDCQT